jgi:hypothetical protein
MPKTPPNVGRVHKGVRDGGRFKAIHKGANLSDADSPTMGIDIILGKLGSITKDQLTQLGTEWSNSFTVHTAKQLAERNDTIKAMFDARDQLEPGVWEVAENHARQLVSKVIGRQPDFAVGFISSWNAIKDAVSATLVKDDLTDKQYKRLVTPWTNVMETAEGGEDVQAKSS